jgi:hypothetical protein
VPDEGFTELAGLRVALRRFRPDDVAAFVAYRSAEQVARFQSWDAPYPQEEGERSIRGDRQVRAERHVRPDNRPGPGTDDDICRRQIHPARRKLMTIPASLATPAMPPPSTTPRLIRPVCLRSAAPHGAGGLMG